MSIIKDTIAFKRAADFEMLQGPLYDFAYAARMRRLCELEGDPAEAERYRLRENAALEAWILETQELIRGVA